MERRRIVLTAVVVASAAGAVLLWRSDAFQSAAFPRRFWSHRVQELEWRCQFYQSSQLTTKLEMSKALATCKYDVMQDRLSAELFGMDPDKATEDAIAREREEMEALREALSFMCEEERRARKELAFAKAQLQHHR